MNWYPIHTRHVSIGFGLDPAILFGAEVRQWCGWRGCSVALWLGPVSMTVTWLFARQIDLDGLLGLEEEKAR